MWGRLALIAVSACSGAPSHSGKLLVYTGPAYEELTHSDFFTFFGVTETARELAGSQTRMHFKTGGFRDKVDLELLVSSGGEVTEAALTLDREWIGDRAHVDEFAKDITRSFLITFHARSDAYEMRRFADGITTVLGKLDVYVELTPQPDDPLPYRDVKEAVAVYLGERSAFAGRMHDTQLRFAGVTTSGEKRVRIAIIFRQYSE